MRPYQKLFFIVFFILLPAITKAELQPVYTPHGTEILYPGILHNATTLGHYGVSMTGRIANQRNDNAAFAFTGAFPLSFRFKEDDRNSGWAFGFAAGVNSYVFEKKEILSPALYFWEMMLGRGSNHSDRNIQTGLLGFFEVTIRNERARDTGDQSIILADHNRVLESHRYSLNLRIGSSFNPLGSGLVRQKAGRLSSSLFLYLSVPIQNQEWRGSLHYQALIRLWKRLLLIGDFGVFGSYADDRILDAADDLKAILFWGPKLEYRLARQSFSLGAQWKQYRASQKRYLKAEPSLLATYQLAF